MVGTSRKDILVFSVVVLCLLWQTSGLKKQREGFGKARRRPNIIFILTDDQDSELGSLNVMNKTREIFNGGTQFMNAFVTSPICCPSRSSILTGMYAHNHNTLTNNLNCSSLDWRRGPERRSYGKFLHEAGYHTGYFGKYLNEYDGSYIPTGWNKWVGLVRNSRFYNYVLRHNSGHKRHYNNYKNDYFTNVITDHGLTFFKNAKQRKPDRPVMMVISHSAPHGPEDGAPQYQTYFPNATAPRLPNWNFISPDKHWIVRVTPPMTEQKMAFADMLQRKRLQTLMSVDDSIQRVWDMLKETGHDRDTYVFFSSDHGYHLGQYGLVKGKSMPYESDIRVPFYARGPGIPANSKMYQMVLNIDLAPTFLDIAGVKPPRTMDGVSVMRLFRPSRPAKPETARHRRRDNMPWRDTFLVERGKIPKYAKKSQPKHSRKQSQKLSKAVVLERFCKMPANQLPCKPNQKWHCITVNSQPRLRKCKKVGQTSAHVGPSPTTAPKEMCTCYRPKISNLFPDDQQEIPYGDDGLTYIDFNKVEHSSRRLRRSPSSSYRKPLSLKQKRLMRELARMIKQQKRRERAKLLAQHRAPTTQPPVVMLESKLNRLNVRIAGIKQRLESLRDRKKKLQRLKEEQQTARMFKNRYEEFPCPCPYPSQSRMRPRRSQKKKQAWRLRSGIVDAVHAGKKKKIKKKGKKGKNPRRSKCSVSGLSCFYQTNYHWKVPPLWTGGEFCFCPSSSNNTYWCLRTINATHNFLYCEFITQFLEYFDLRLDPYQLYNIVDQISPSVLYDLHNQLDVMRRCKGARSCTHYYGKPLVTSPQLKAQSLKTPPTVATVKHTDVKTEGSAATPTTEGIKISTENCTVIAPSVNEKDIDKSGGNLESGSVGIGNQENGSNADSYDSKGQGTKVNFEMKGTKNMNKVVIKESTNSSSVSSSLLKTKKEQRKLNKRTKQKKKTNANTKRRDKLLQKKKSSKNKGQKKLKKKDKTKKDTAKRNKNKNNAKLPNEQAADIENMAYNRENGTAASFDP